MKDYVVIYKTKYGSAERYAKWIAEDLECEALCVDEVKRSQQLKEYGTVIYGGGLHAGGIRGFDRMKKLLKPFLAGGERNEAGEVPRVIVFAVGLSTDDKNARMQTRDINLDSEYLRALPCFFLKGAYDPAKIKGFDALLMKVVKRMSKPQGEKNGKGTKRLNGEKGGTDDGSEAENLGMFFERGCDMVSREQIVPIVEEARRLPVDERGSNS